jgi:hypothetical protein
VGDRITRVLLTFFGPAQLGRSPSSDSRRPEGGDPDAGGITHRTLVPDEPAR